MIQCHVDNNKNVIIGGVLFLLQLQTTVNCMHGLTLKMVQKVIASMDDEIAQIMLKGSISVAYVLFALVPWQANVGLEKTA